MQFNVAPRQEPDYVITLTVTPQEREALRRYFGGESISGFARRATCIEAVARHLSGKMFQAFGGHE